MTRDYYGKQKSGDPKTELEHWKYIKKVRKSNGKWRYYYPGDLIEDATNEVKDALGFDERDRLKDADLQYEYAQKNYYNREFRSRQEAMTQKAKLEEAGRNAVNAWKEFKRTPLGIVTNASEKVQRTVRSAREFVDDIISHFRSTRYKLW